MSTRGPRLALLAGDFALYLEGGGHWSWFLQYVLGLRELGVAFDWLEYVPHPIASRISIRRDWMPSTGGSHATDLRTSAVSSPWSTAG